MGSTGCRKGESHSELAMLFKMKKNFLLHNIPLTLLPGQILIGSIIGSLVFFILLVFQPFGTYDFLIAHKTLFLLGYGILTAASYIIFYLFGFLFFTKWFDAQKWNLLKEIISFFVVFNLMTLVCLVYHQQLIGGYYITFPVYFGFLKYSLAVGCLPFFVLYYQKWISRRLTKVNVEISNEIESTKVKFCSTNKNESPVELFENEILFLKSDGNYLEIVSFIESKVEKQLIRITLNNALAQLPVENFLKIHRSYIVNLRFVQSITLDGSNYEVKLKDVQTKLPVSRSMVKLLKQLIG